MPAALAPVVPLAAGAAGGAIGSAASQGVAIGLGQQSSFSFSAVGTAALGSAIGAGLNQVTSIVPTEVGRAVANNALTQGVNIALGRQERFSFVSVAAAAAVAGIGQQFKDTPLARFTDQAVRNSGFGDPAALAGNVALNLVQGVIVRGAQSVFERGGRISFATLAADSFGNTLGNAIIGEIRIQSARARLSTQGLRAYDEARANNQSRLQAVAFGQAVDENPKLANRVLRQNGGNFFPPTASALDDTRQTTIRPGNGLNDYIDGTGSDGNLPVFQLTGLEVIVDSNATLAQRAQAAFDALTRAKPRIDAEYLAAVRSFADGTYRAPSASGRPSYATRLLAANAQAFNQLPGQARDFLQDRAVQLGALGNNLQGQGFVQGYIGGRLKAAGAAIYVGAEFLPRTYVQGAAELAGGEVFGLGAKLAGRYLPQLPGPLGIPFRTDFGLSLRQGGITLSNETGNYLLRSPLRLDVQPGTVYSGIPVDAIKAQNPLVRLGAEGATSSSDPVVLDLFGGKASQTPGAINVDLIAQDGIQASATKLPFGTGVADRVIASNPYIPGGSGITDFLPEASRVLKDGGELVINATFKNKFGNLPTPDILQELGLEVVQYRGPLLPEFQNHIFQQTTGIPIPNASVTSTILRKAGGG